MEKSLFMKKISTKLLKSNVLPFNFTFWTTSITINIVSIISISWIVVESNPITSNLFSDVFCLSVSSSSPTFFYVSAWASSIIITCVTVIAICAWSSVIVYHLHRFQNKYLLMKHFHHYKSILLQDCKQYFNHHSLQYYHHRNMFEHY